MVKRTHILIIFMSPKNVGVPTFVSITSLDYHSTENCTQMNPDTVYPPLQVEASIRAQGHNVPWQPALHGFDLMTYQSQDGTSLSNGRPAIRKNVDLI